MSSKSVFVLLSTSCVNSHKFESIQNVFANNDSVKILNTTTIVLTEEQKQAIPIENASQFFNGPIASYLLQSETEIDFVAIQKSNKLSKTDIFETCDTFFVAKLKNIFFPQKKSLEYTLIICDPSLSEQHLNEIMQELKLKGIFILFENEISSENNAKILQLLNKNNGNINIEEKYETDIIKCRAILCESFGCNDKIKLIIGCNDSELGEKYAPNSWNNRFKENNYKFIQISDELQIESFIPKLDTQQTLALIKPTAVRQGYVDEIRKEIEQNGFTILSQKRVHLELEHAQHFYKEHEGKPFFDELTSFMSSGPIYAFILERIAGIACWRTLLGPTNTFAAKEKAPQSLRARYGTNQTENACHGSDSVLSSKREIKFYFPEIRLSSNEIKTKKSANIVEEYMLQKLENDESLKEFLIRGLSELAKQKPGSKLEVVEWFGHWLLNNNPNKPQIDEPNDMLIID